MGFPAPLQVGFELTHLCNLSCGYCDRHTPGPDEMTLPQILKVLGELRHLGMQEISLDGGEPLAHRNVEDVVDALVKWGVVVRMNTNGILVPRKIDVVRRLSKVKISLDGPERCHDGMRGGGAFAKAIRGALVARDEAAVPVELTCVVGAHNADSLEELMDLAEQLGFGIVFQPARSSLFLDTDRDGADFVLGHEDVRSAFRKIERRKRRSPVVLNGWASLRHFRRFPHDVALPCAAGHINVTLDPAGHLYHCGQVSRLNRSNNVLELGVAECLRRLRRRGCKQCWCARVVEENYAWGARVDRMLPLDTADAPPSG